MEWDENLHRKSSEIYQIISKELEDELMNLFRDVPSDKSSQVMVKVSKFTPGSVVVHYTVGWLAERDVLTSATVRNCSILCRSPLVKSLDYHRLTLQIEFFIITPFTTGLYPGSLHNINWNISGTKSPLLSNTATGNYLGSLR